MNGYILKKLREQHNLTQKELASILNLTPKAISFYENDQRTPSTDLQNKICDYFNVSMDYLSGRDSTKSSTDNTIYNSIKQPILSDAELEHLKKYRYISDNGKEIVDSTLNSIYNQQQNSNKKECVS